MAKRIKDLSVEAQCIYGGHYQFMKTMEMTFQRPWVISDSMLNGLNELIESGYLIKEESGSKHSDATTFKPTQLMLDCKERVSQEFMEEHGRFKIIDESKKKLGTD